MLNNYDHIAASYDWLSRLVYGRAQVNAQVDLLPYAGEEGRWGGGAGRPLRVLIAGGGTGWILEELAALYPSGLQIIYVEISGKMLDLARRRSVGGNQVEFVHLPIEEFRMEEGVDCVLTGFLFDNFSPERARRVFDLLDGLLKPGGRWLNADFHYSRGPGRWWQFLLLRMMYSFFRLICQVEGKTLVHMEPLFTAAGYRTLHMVFRYGRFIRGIVYEKAKGDSQDGRGAIR